MNRPWDVSPRLLKKKCRRSKRINARDSRLHCLPVTTHVKFPVSNRQICVHYLSNLINFPKRVGFLKFKFLCNYCLIFFYIAIFIIEVHLSTSFFAPYHLKISISVKCIIRLGTGQAVTLLRSEVAEQGFSHHFWRLSKAQKCSPNSDRSMTIVGKFWD